MRNTFLSLIAFLTIFAVLCAPLLASSGPEVTAPMANNPPILDGTISNNEWPDGIEVTPDNGFWDPSVAGGNETELSYVFHVMYDANYIYVAASMTDDDIQTDSAAAKSQDGNTWNDDCMEVYFDADHDHADGDQFAITPNEAVRFPAGKSFGDDPGDDYYVVAAIHGDNNWQFEAQYLISQYGNLQAGSVIGFEMGCNDDDGGGSEDGALFWAGEGAVGCICSSEDLWGDLIFGEETFSAVQPNHKLATAWGKLKVKGE